MKWTAGTSKYQTDKVAIDPIADWLFRNGPASADTEFQVLIKLRAGKNADQFQSFNGKISPEEILFGSVTLEQWVKAIRIPKMYTRVRKTEDILPDLRYCTAKIQAIFLDWLHDVPAVQAFVESITLCIAPTVNIHDADPMSGGGRGATNFTAAADAVTMGIIDHGLPLAHPSFFYSDPAKLPPLQSRVVAAWFQDVEPTHRFGAEVGAGAALFGAPAVPAAIAAAASPKASVLLPVGSGLLKLREFFYGAELISSHIANIYDKAGRDETLFYKTARLFQPNRSTPKSDTPAQQTDWTKKRSTHGAAIMGLAGATARTSGPPDRPIVAVHLPEVTVEDGSGYSLAAHVVDALRYILREAEGITNGKSEICPLVVTLSYGHNSGPHDGRSPLEEAMNEMVDAWRVKHPGTPFALVVPAGNSFQSTLHARWTAEEILPTNAKSNAVHWQILPDDPTPNIIQLWMPKGYKGTLEARLETPAGQAVTISTSNAAGHDLHTLTDADGRIIAQGLWCPEASGGHQRGMIQIIVGATKADASQAYARAPAGLWKLTITSSDLGKTDEIHAWVQRDDIPRSTSRRARQSYFVDDRMTPYNPPGQPADGSIEAGPVRRPGLINAIATGPGTIVAGAGFVAAGLDPNLPPTTANQPIANPCLPSATLYSGGGDVRTGGDGVDVIMSSDDSPVNLGKMVSGMRGGSHVRMSGTSIAAPLAAREIAGNISLFVSKHPKAGMADLVLAKGVPGKYPVNGTKDPRLGNGQLPPP